MVNWTRKFMIFVLVLYACAYYVQCFSTKINTNGTSMFQLINMRMIFCSDSFSLCFWPVMCWLCNAKKNKNKKYSRIYKTNNINVSHLWAFRQTMFVCSECMNFGLPKKSKKKKINTMTTISVTSHLCEEQKNLSFFALNSRFLFDRKRKICRLTLWEPKKKTEQITKNKIKIPLISIISRNDGQKCSKCQQEPNRNMYAKKKIIE